MKGFNRKDVRLWAYALPLVTSFLLSPVNQIYGATCCEERVVEEQCARTVDPGDTDIPVGSGVIEQTVFECWSGNYWATKAWNRQVGSCDPDNYPSRSIDPGECNCDDDGGICPE
jgi:hypothetical protein